MKQVNNYSHICYTNQHQWNIIAKPITKHGMTFNSKLAHKKKIKKIQYTGVNQCDERTWFIIFIYITSDINSVLYE